jgi:hypothetical protein
VFKQSLGENASAIQPRSPEDEASLEMNFDMDLSAVFGDMKIIGEIYKPELFLLLLGNRFTMDPTEATYAATLLGSKYVVPMHYGTFPLLTGTPEMFVKLMKEAWGDSDYEYVMTIPAKSMPSLYGLLGVEVGDQKALLKALAKRFHGNKCFSDIGDFLDNNGIEHETFTWA